MKTRKEEEPEKMRTIHRLAINQRGLVLLFFLLFPLLIKANGDLSENKDSTNFLNKVSGLGELILDKVTWQNNSRVLAIYPSGGYSARTELEFGVMPIFSWENSQNRLQNSKQVNTFTTSFQVSTRGMLLLNAELECFPSDVWQIKANAEWMKINDKFWDVYSGETLRNGINYQSEQLGGNAEFIRKLNKTMSIGAALKSYYHSFEQSGNEIFLPPEVMGYAGGMVSGLGIVAQFDSRDHTLFPLSGILFKSSLLTFSKAFLSDYNYSNLLVDARHYKSIGKSVIASQFLWDYTFGDVPFYMLPQLGGKYRLRGIGHSQRVIDNNLRMLRSELRFPVWWRFGAVVFAEVGDAHNNLSFNTRDVIFSGGAGIRFRALPNEPLNVRIDAGFTSNGLTGVYVTLREAF